MAQTHTRKQHFPYDPWKVSETAFDPKRTRFMEAVLALSNGYLGLRSSFEEGLPGAETLRGTYVAGVFDSYPNPTMVRLKGRPTHPSQMVNLPDFALISAWVDGESLDLSTVALEEYSRTLHMDRGVLTRNWVCRTPRGARVRVACTRFLSRPRPHVAAFRVAVTPLDRPAAIRFTSTINGDVANATTRHIADVATWRDEQEGFHGLTCRTRGTGITMALLAHESLNGAQLGISPDTTTPLASASAGELQCQAGQTATLDKIVAVTTSRDPDAGTRSPAGILQDAATAGFDRLLQEHEQAWAAVWRTAEIEIRDRSGSTELTQGLHYSLFQMIQNAPSRDHTVNIGAKGLTGEHYYGTYFWDTEAYMLPMFGFVMPEIARNLVKSRFHFLPGARAKAKELDLRGAAFPFMSDANGNESCTLWQFGLLGIHVTADVAWGIWFYYCVTGDLDFIAADGIDVMVETSRFWQSRAYYRADISRYVINRVLGPDEYHQGVDNNYYTNIMARENLLQTIALLKLLQKQRPEALTIACRRLSLTSPELEEFQAIAEKLHLPRNEQRRLNMQDDSFHLLEPYDLKSNPPPGAIVQAWSYDRLMRTQLLRQADIVVAHILVGNRFSKDDMRRDFEYYEPITTHDSSLSFCSHSIVAAQLGELDMAVDYFLRTARLDLDDIHGNAWMGIHTACLAGAWQCVVLGFGGVRWYEGKLSLAPKLPPQWEEFSFSIAWRGSRIKVRVTEKAVQLSSDGKDVPARLLDQDIVITPTVRSYDSL